MQPEIHLGPIDLQTFGLAFACAFLASGALFARRLRELGRPADWTYEAVFAALIGGLVGSRLDYIIQNWDDVSGDLLGNVFSGAGLVFFCGLIGGAIGVILWARWRGYLGWELLDAAAAPIAIGYAVGRRRLRPAVRRALGDVLPRRHRSDHGRGPSDARLRDALDGSGHAAVVEPARPAGARHVVRSLPDFRWGGALSGRVH